MPAATMMAARPVTVKATVAAAPTRGMSRNVATTYAAAHAPPSQPHHGTARRPASRGTGVRRRASSTSSVTNRMRRPSLCIFITDSMDLTDGADTPLVRLTIYTRGDARAYVCQLGW